MDTMKQIAHFVRWRDWGPRKLTIWWSLCLYLALRDDLEAAHFLQDFVIYFIFAITQATLGYVLNDWGDRKLDRRQFKRNSFAGKTPLESVMALILVLVLALIAGLPLIRRAGFGLLWLIWAVAAAAYSLEPLRLKTRGLVGWLVGVAAQWFLPVLLTFSAFQVQGGLDMWLLAGALSLIGASQDLAHQRANRRRDLLTHAETFAASLPETFVDHLYAALLLLDKLSVGFVLGIFAYGLRLVELPWGSWFATGLAAAYSVLLLVTFWRSWRSLFGNAIADPYFGPGSEGSAAARLLHLTLLEIFAPLALGVVQALHSPLYSLVLAPWLVWRLVLHPKIWRMSLSGLRTRPIK
jgi:4-hydroxybenzoate polyprenyltransferase